MRCFSGQRMNIGFDGKVRIKTSEDVKQQYREQVLKKSGVGREVDNRLFRFWY